MKLADLRDRLKDGLRSTMNGFMGAKAESNDDVFLIGDGWKGDLDHDTTCDFLMCMSVMIYRREEDGRWACSAHAHDECWPDFDHYHDTAYGRTGPSIQNAGLHRHATPFGVTSPERTGKKHYHLIPSKSGGAYPHTDCATASDPKQDEEWFPIANANDTKCHLEGCDKERKFGRVVGSIMIFACEDHNDDLLYPETKLKVMAM